MPIGVNTKMASHMPTSGVAILSFANFSPNILSRWKIRKNKMATTKGIPSPPFLMIDPKGAPIKNNTRQASDKENFRCHSIKLLRMPLFLLSISVPIDW